MDAVALLEAMDEALREHSADIDASKWCLPAYRTHFMKGNAVKGQVSGRDHGVLQTTMKSLGYVCDNTGQAVGSSAPPGCDQHHRVYGWEWLKIDLVAATSPGPWGSCVWKGQYRLDLALELENSLGEFTLHMRGLLDANAALRVGVFYADRGLDEIMVGTGSGPVALAGWVPPWTVDDGWGGRPPTADAPLLAVFLSEIEPRILGARRWSSPSADSHEVTWKRAGSA